MNNEKSAKTGFIFGVISLIMWVLPLFGYITSIAGIINCLDGLKSMEYKKRALTGIILSIMGLVLTLINQFVLKLL